MKFIVAVGLLWLASGGDAIASETRVATATDNAEMTELFTLDQSDRNKADFKSDLNGMLKRDKARQQGVLELLRGGQLHSAGDYSHAAMIFQHSPDDIGLAHALATIASYLDPEEKAHRWLIAASWDRMLMQHIQPQWYGTQYQSDANGTYLFPVAAGAVTDKERADMGVPSLQEARSRLPDMAKMMGEKVRAVPPAIEELQAKAARDNSVTLPSSGRTDPEN